MDAKETNKKSNERLASVAASAADCKTPLFKARQLLASLQCSEKSTETQSILNELEEAINVIAASIEKIQAATQSSAGNEKALQGLRVLLVDDDEIAGAMTTRVLERNGADIVRAYDGKAATELSAAHDFDIILMDVQMPVMDGLAASRIIRNQQKKTTPIIALTAEKAEAYPSYADAGMTTALAKPFKEQMLVDAILNCLNRNAQPQHPGSQPQHADTKQSADQSLYSLDKLTSMGDQQFVLRMLGLFIEQVPSSVAKLKEAYNAADFDTVKYIAHRIRPSLQNMNIAALQDANQIEQLSDSKKRSPELEQLITNLEAATTTVATELRKYLDKQ